MLNENTPLCRICFEGGDIEDGKPLNQPCACRGSIGHMHQSCLMQWVTVSGSSICEICLHQFAGVLTDVNLVPNAVRQPGVRRTAFRRVVFALMGLAVCVKITMFGTPGVVEWVVVSFISIITMLYIIKVVSDCITI
jgi:E3 ubiquitin-protein ligase DOA10